MRTFLAVLVLGALLVACGGGDTADTADTAPAATATAEQAARLWSSHRRAPRAASTPTGECFGAGPGDYVDALQRDEGERAFRIHVPPAYNGRSRVPLLLNFHGQGKHALDQETYSGLVEVSDANGFILVSPEGAFAQWNIVGIYAEDGVDDVAAVADIVDYMTSHFCIDVDRVFATGLSNGAEMAAQVACFLPGVFAGIAPVAGIEYQGCEGPPVAVITFHGTDDYNVPYEPIPDIVGEWVRYNGCPETPETERIGQEVMRESYFGCSGAPVVFYTLEGGGHTWPGATSDSGGVGPTNREINASQLIWEFFRNVRRVR